MPLSELSAWLPAGQVDQKRVDALEMIAAIRTHLAAGVTPLTISYRFQDTGYHKAVAQRFIALANRLGTGPAENTLSSAAVE